MTDAPVCVNGYRTVDADGISCLKGFGSAYQPPFDQEGRWIDNEQNLDSGYRASVAPSAVYTAGRRECIQHRARHRTTQFHKQGHPK
jgi:hypothetical protein